jgi:hypothetical protein
MRACSLMCHRKPTHQLLRQYTDALSVDANRTRSHCVQVLSKDLASNRARRNLAPILIPANAFTGLRACLQYARQARWLI